MTKYEWTDPNGVLHDTESTKPVTHAWVAQEDFVSTLENIRLMLESPANEWRDYWLRTRDFYETLRARGIDHNYRVCSWHGSLEEANRTLPYFDSNEVGMVVNINRPRRGHKEEA